jgi:hypothetical protein
MRLALRAQSQMVTALEKLALIKNPPRPTFVQRANIANGPQQVNNGHAREQDSAEVRAGARAREAPVTVKKADPTVGGAR